MAPQVLQKPCQKRVAGGLGRGNLATWATPLVFDRVSIMGLRILVVDDHAGSLHALSKLLALSGHVVTSANCAEVALRLAGEAGGCDLVVADVGLPHGAALDLMRQARRAFGAVGIALTADDDEPADPAWRDAGYCVRLRKPLRFREVEAAVRVVMARAGAVAGAGAARRRNATTGGERPFDAGPGPSAVDGPTSPAPRRGAAGESREPARPPDPAPTALPRV